MAKHLNVSDEVGKQAVQIFLASAGGDPTETTLRNQIHRNVWIYAVNITVDGNTTKGVFFGKYSNGKLKGSFVSNDGSVSGGKVELTAGEEYGGNYSGTSGGKEIETSGLAFMPYDPESLDKVQVRMLQNMLRKILKIGSNDEDKENLLIKVDGDYGYSGSQWIIMRNPFYKPVDPSVFITGDKNPNGALRFYRNPFAPPAQYNVFSSYAEALFNSDFNPGNIDPVNK
jgi:hypothetical protein